MFPVYLSIVYVEANKKGCKPFFPLAGKWVTYITVILTVGFSLPKHFCIYVT